MNLTILGFSPPYPNPNIATSSYLVKFAKNTILLDCGHGAVSKLLQVEKPDKLTGIIISHMHPDHFYDLVPLRNVFFKNKLKKILLFLPPGGMKILSNVIKATELPEDYMSDYFLMSEYEPDSVLKIDPMEITFLQTIHPINTYAMTFLEKNSNKKFVFTSDTAVFDRLIYFCHNADLMLIECTDVQIPDDVKRWHLSLTEVSDIVNQAQVKRTIITHYETKDSKKIIEATGKSSNIFLAEEFKEYKI